MKKILFFILLTTLFLSCNDDTATTFSFGDTISLMESDPKQFLLKLDTVSLHDGRMEGDREATSFLVKAMCDNFIDGNIYPSSGDMEKCVSVLSDSHDTGKIIESLLFLAKVYHHEHNIPDEVLTINRAMSIAKAGADDKWIFYLYAYLMETFFYVHDLSIYSECLEKTERFYQSPDYASFEVYTRILVGTTHILNSQYDKAFSVLDDLSQTIGDSHAYYGRCHFLLGFVSFKKGDWDSCIYHLNRALPNIQNISDLYLAYSMLAYSYNRTNENDHAVRCKEMAVRYEEHEDIGFMEIEFYKACADFANGTDDLSEKLYYLNKIVKIYDMISSQYDRVGNLFINDKLVNMETEYTVYMYATGFLSVLFVLFFMVYIRQKERQDHHLNFLQEQIDKSRDMAESVEQVKYMFKRDIEAARRIYYLLYSDRVRGEKLLNEIEKLNISEGNALLNMQWENFFRHINIIYDDFQLRLVEKFPSLNDKEIQLCCMLMADFRAEEISVVWKQSIYTVHKCKTNVRKKVSSSEGENLILFLKEKLY